jgi:hypothetical protein
MNTCGRVVRYIGLQFLVSVLDASGWSASNPGHSRLFHWRLCDLQGPSSGFGEVILYFFVRESNFGLQAWSTLTVIKMFLLLERLKKTTRKITSCSVYFGWIHLHSFTLTNKLLDVRVCVQTLSNSRLL